MSVPFPLFPSRFPFPRSLPEAVSGVCDSHESPSFQVCAFPSLLLFPLFPALFPYWRLCPCPLSLLTIMSLPSFPIDDYVPALFSYFRLCSLFPSLFLIMPWHSLSLMSLCYFCKIVGNAIFDAVSAWVNGPDNYYLCTKLYSKVPHYFSAGEPSWNNECSRPLK
jgi:hypothetical protein